MAQPAAAPGERDQDERKKDNNKVPAGDIDRQPEQPPFRFPAENPSPQPTKAGVAKA